MEHRRVVVTGMGIVSCIGNNVGEALDSLKKGRSGITASPEYAAMGFRSQIYGKPDINLTTQVDKRLLRFMGDGAAYAYIAMRDAIADAGLERTDIINPRSGIVVGSGGPSARAQVLAADIARDKGPKRVGPFAVPKCMCSTLSANLATAFEIKGVNYSISSACATSSHCIGNAADLIRFGRQDVMFAGGGEELDWTLSVLFDAMGAMSGGYNATPSKASRPYDARRDGFVIAGGGGILVLEELSHARARGAKIYAELTGYGATSDGADMVSPNGEGAARCMREALATVRTPVTYINTHGTSTLVGDTKELEAIREIFGKEVPPLSSTKSMTGHSLGATGAQEAIFSLLMMQHGFIAPSINIDTFDDAAKGFDVVQRLREGVAHETVLSNSFGFGGTNCTLAFSKMKG